MKTLWTDIREGWRAMQYHYTGPGAALHLIALAVRCLLWWVMGCILLFTVYGGLLLFYLEQMPGRVASTIPGLLTVVHEVVVLWQWQCITVLSSVLPLFCLWVTLVHFIWVRPANADRTRIPFNPRR
ncbi:hypothetical protein SL932_28400 [Klebsiella pneumoniae]|uniref:Uncharacterized protein n=1 Tax=Citrobacter freundii TaxID=546 RepID=A0AA44SJJ2_CITFR|nr:MULTISPECIES: hypothetical protein [Enterobacteriaceae]EAR6709200.1 hypothetical protein [Salmonella enterica]ECU3077739.1 hypothetical protein [Salmonella enterica subsp. enterica serovar Typhimurium]EEE9160378.1 hypothetical protein [Salmonella enterica subsp. enterica serovar Kimberley]UII02638.1 hypothetical protein [Enterobacter cloacae]HCT5822272.1 hypothetical protein [Citrobacter sedlakii]